MIARGADLPRPRQAPHEQLVGAVIERVQRERPRRQGGTVKGRTGSQGTQRRIPQHGLADARKAPALHQQPRIELRARAGIDPLQQLAANERRIRLAGSQRKHVHRDPRRQAQLQGSPRRVPGTPSARRTCAKVQRSAPSGSSASPKIRPASRVRAMTGELVVVERGRRLAFSFEDLMRYHGPGSPGGVAHAFKVLERALPLLEPEGACERRELTVRTAFGGPGARDAFELVTRAVTGGRYASTPRWPGRSAGGRASASSSGSGYRDRVVVLDLREGFVTDEFIDLARAEHATPPRSAASTRSSSRWPTGSWPGRPRRSTTPTRSRICAARRGDNSPPHQPQDRTNRRGASERRGPGRPPARRDARAGRASRRPPRLPPARCAPIGCRSRRSGR